MLYSVCSLTTLLAAIPALSRLPLIFPLFSRARCGVRVYDAESLQLLHDFRERDGELVMTMVAVDGLSPSSRPGSL